MTPRSTRLLFYWILALMNLATNFARAENSLLDPRAVYPETNSTRLSSQRFILGQPRPVVAPTAAALEPERVTDPLTEGPRASRATLTVTTTTTLISTAAAPATAARPNAPASPTAPNAAKPTQKLAGATVPTPPQKDPEDDEELPWSESDRPTDQRDEQLPPEPPQDLRKASQAEGACTTCGKLQKAQQHAQDIKAKAAQQLEPVRSNMSVMQALGWAAAAGYGRLPTKRPLCYRAVKKIIRKADPAAGKYLNGGSAIDALSELPKAGYRNMYPQQCNDIGAIRVYKGPANKMSKKAARQLMMSRYGVRLTAGDIHGHIEVVGSDKRFHHFLTSGRPINDPRHFGPWRRQLVGCFVKAN